MMPLTHTSASSLMMYWFWIALMLNVDFLETSCDTQLDEKARATMNTGGPLKRLSCISRT
eukprot:4287646-Amphidinium_carterae.1